MRTLGEIVEEDRPITYGIVKPGHGCPGGVPVVKVKDMHDGIIDESDLLLTTPELDYQYRRSRLRKGDLLISIRGSVGRLAEIPANLEDANITQDTARLTIRSQYNRIYVRGVLESPILQREMEKNIRGVAVKGINIGYLRELKIPVCSRERQDELARIYQQSDKSKFAWLKSQFIEMFGDPTTNTKDLPIANLPELGENLDNKRIPITGGDRKAGKYPYYGASGIVDYVADYIFDDDLLLISEDGANLVARVTPIAFPSTGKVWINNHAHVVKFKSMAMQCYVENLLNMIDISPYVTGTAQPKLNQAKLNTIPIPVPEENMIHEYLAFVHQSDKSK